MDKLYSLTVVTFFMEKRGMTTINGSAHISQPMRTYDHWALVYQNSFSELPASQKNKNMDMQGD